MTISSTAFGAGDILLPKQGTDMTKWAAVACDQFTSQPEYWEKAYSIADGAPSTLDLILPEAYLESPDAEDRITAVNREMEHYINDGLFDCYPDSMIYLERTDSCGAVRAGIIGVIDLEKYDYSKGSTTEVRATEATVPERIPPRLKVRRNALVELPHIMILIDDPQLTVIEEITKKRSSLKKLYDFELMLGGGRAAGYLMDADDISKTDSALAQLKEKSGGLLYAMGDGNHSLATAKAFYEELKKQSPDMDTQKCPARYALAEIVNLHSPALNFEAIHRIISDVDPDSLLAALDSRLGLAEETQGTRSFTWISGGRSTVYSITKPCSNLTVGSVQSVIDDFIRTNGGKIDYIHGEDVVRELAKADSSAGILLPDMGKEELFPTVIRDGALPRKTFSMGHAEDKRYYIEARLIR